MRFAAVMLSLFVGLAGCTSGGGGAAPPADDTPDSPGTDPLIDDEAPPEPDPPRTEYWYLEADALVSEAPGDGEILIDCGAQVLTPLCDWSDIEYFSDPFEVDTLIVSDEIDVKIVLQAEAVAVGNPAFDLGVWIGTTRGSLGIGLTANTVLTNTPTEVTFQFDFSNRPATVIPAGESLMLRIVAVYEPEVPAQAKILTGASYETGFEITLQNQTENVVFEVDTDQSFTGTLQGGAFAQCHPGTEIHRFTVDPAATFVDIILTAAPTIPGVTTDVDLDFYDGFFAIAHAGSPYPEEEILLIGPGLEPYLGKEVGVGATICLGGQASYEIVIEQGLAEA